MLGDIPWTGVGAGAAGILLPTYAELKADLSLFTPASAAASMFAGIGPLFFWVTLLASAAAVCGFFAGSLNRGRDWSFAASAACAVPALVVASFLLPVIFSAPTIILISAVLGMGSAQRISRTRI
jgi:hypothetical protein